MRIPCAASLYDLLRNELRWLEAIEMREERDRNGKAAQNPGDLLPRWLEVCGHAGELARPASTSYKSTLHAGGPLAT
jgi:hypothetical protein